MTKLRGAALRHCSGWQLTALEKGGAEAEAGGRGGGGGGGGGGGEAGKEQTPNTGLRHPSLGGRCRKAVLGVWGSKDDAV